MKKTYCLKLITVITVITFVMIACSAEGNLGGNTPTKTVTVGLQEGEYIVEGTGGTATFNVTTINIANGTYSISVKLAEGTGLPAGVSVPVSLTLTAGAGTLNLSVGSTAAKGEYSLTLTIDGTTSTAFDLIIGKGEVSYTVDTQIGNILHGSGGTATYMVTTKNVDEDNGVIFTWCDSSGNTASRPAGYVSGETVPDVATNGITTVTLVFDTAAVKGSYYFKLTIAGVVSTSVSLVYIDDIGTGTQADPWRVRTATQLVEVGRARAGYTGWNMSAHYRQIDHITLTSNWTPIPGYLTGSYDGGGFEIIGLTASGSASTQGFFVSIDSDGIVQNVILVDVNINFTGANTGYSAGIAGASTGKVLNCSVSGIVKGYGNVGGIVGRNNNSSATVQSCIFSGSVTGSFNIVGGIAGMNHGTVKDCYTIGSVSGADNVGGIAGYNSTGAALQNCVALNESITGTPTYGRVAGINLGTLTNNYARDDMKVNGATVTPGANHGEDVGGTQYNTKAWWNKDNTPTAGPAGWDFSSTGAWTWDSVKNLPVLR